MVEDWLGLFIATHVMRFPREDWPPDGTEDAQMFWSAWRHQFIIKGVSESFATRASLDLTATPPRWLGDHLPAVLGLATEAMRQAQATAGGAAEATDLESAKVASRSCPDCQGSGSAVRHVHAAIEGRMKSASGEPLPIGARFSLPCSCPLGRFMARGMTPEGSSSPPLTVDRFPSLALGPVPWSDSPDNQFRHHPRDWDSDLGRPIPIDGPGPDEGAIAFMERLRGSLAGHRTQQATIYRPAPPERTTGLPAAFPGHPPGQPTAEIAAGDPAIDREPWLTGREAPALSRHPARPGDDPYFIDEDGTPFY